MTTLSDVMDAVVEMLSAVSSLKNATRYIPASINSADLPLALIKPGESTWNLHSGMMAAQSRKLTVFVIVQPVNEGIYDEGITKTTDLLDDCGKTLMKHFLNSDCSLFQKSFPFSDTGHILITYGNVQYHGFSITFPVTFPSDLSQ